MKTGRRAAGTSGARRGQVAEAVAEEESGKFSVCLSSWADSLHRSCADHDGGPGGAGGLRSWTTCPWEGAGLRKHGKPWGLREVCGCGRETKSFSAVLLGCLRSVCG